DQFDEFAAEVIRQAEEMGLAPEIIEELRDAMEGAGGAAADAAPEFAAVDKELLHLAKHGDAADVLARMEAEAESANPDLQEFAEAVRDIRNALLEATDPAFAAISAQLRADEAIAK